VPETGHAATRPDGSPVSQPGYAVPPSRCRRLRGHLGGDRAIAEQIADAARAVADIGPLPAPQGSATRRRGHGGSGVAAMCSPRMRSAQPLAVTVLKSYDLPRSWARTRSCSSSPTRARPKRPCRSRAAAHEAAATVVALSAGGPWPNSLGAHDWLHVPFPPPCPAAHRLAPRRCPASCSSSDSAFSRTPRGCGGAVTQLLGRRDQLFSPSGPAASRRPTHRRTFPLLHGADGLGAVAATRWKTQINENRSHRRSSAWNPSSATTSSPDGARR